MQPLPRLTSSYSLPRPDGSVIPLTLQPLPLGFFHRLRLRQIEPPAKPTRIARDSNGKPLRDAQGQVVLIPDDNDSTYLAAQDLYHQRVAVLMAAAGLAADPNITFDNQPPPPANIDWRDYADRLYSELETAGFSPGDLATLCSEICRLSNMLTEHVRETQANFSSPAVVPTS